MEVSVESEKKLYIELFTHNFSTHSCIRLRPDPIYMRAWLSIYNKLTLYSYVCYRKYAKSKNCEREIIYAGVFNKSIMSLYFEKMPIQELVLDSAYFGLERYFEFKIARMISAWF